MFNNKLVTLNNLEYFYGKLKDEKAVLDQRIDSKQDIITDIEAIRQGAAKGETALQSYTEKYTGTYSKPEGGIPKTDLSNSVQELLEKAGTALQEDQYKGTVTQVKMNNRTYDQTDGLISLGAVTQAITINGETKTPNVIGVTALGQFATPEDLITKQDTLVSGTNIKTINNESVLGNGNIIIPANVKAVDTQETIDSVGGFKTINGQSILGNGNIEISGGSGGKKLIEYTGNTMNVSSNVYCRNTNTALSTLSISLSAVIDNTILNEYFVEFTTSNSGTAVSLPSTIRWANGETPTFEASTTYQISIVNNLGVVTKFK